MTSNIYPALHYMDAPDTYLMYMYHDVCILSLKKLSQNSGIELLHWAAFAGPRQRQRLLSPIPPKENDDDRLGLDSVCLATRCS